ncbi:MAG: type II toxin-antitoxin system RatA family toxin [Pseudomonadota bacterium]
MSTHSALRRLPYSCEQLFDLAADVESYPEFLPGWVDARILERNGNHLRVEQRLGLKLLPLPFVTTAVLDRPQKVSIHSSDGPFRFLQIEWRFEPAGPGCCTVSLEFNYRLRIGLLDRMAAALFDHSSPEIINRFDKRAHLLYSR